MTPPKVIAKVDEAVRLDTEQRYGGVLLSFDEWNKLRAFVMAGVERKEARARMVVRNKTNIEALQDHMRAENTEDAALAKLD